MKFFGWHWGYWVTAALIAVYAVGVSESRNANLARAERAIGPEDTWLVNLNLDGDDPAPAFLRARKDEYLGFCFQHVQDAAQFNERLQKSGPALIEQYCYESFRDWSSGFGRFDAEFDGGDSQAGRWD